MARFIRPFVNRGIPIPPPPKARKQPKAREYAPSPWVSFLKERSPGESFDAHPSEKETVKRHLEALGIPYERRKIRVRKPNGFMQPYARFWILGPDYVPPYIDAGAGI